MTDAPQLTELLHRAFDGEQPRADAIHDVMAHVRAAAANANTGRAGPAVRQRSGRLVVLLATVILAAAVAGALGAALHHSATRQPAEPAASPTADLRSTLSANSPLVYDTSVGGRLTAWDYEGNRVGTIHVNPDVLAKGCVVSPDGSKIFFGDGRIFDVGGAQLADIGQLRFSLPAGCTQPGSNSGLYMGQAIWADDSDHICGFRGDQQGGMTNTLVEVAATGKVRLVAQVLGGGQLLACSPGADRVVLLEGSPASHVLAVMRLTTGEILATHADTATAASHDGSLVATSDPTGTVTVRDAMTWQPVRQFERRVPGAAFATVIPAMFSWDSSRLLAVGTSVGALAQQPAWVVDWRTGVTLVTNVAGDRSGAQFLAFEPAATVPLLRGTDLLVVTTTATYLLGADGHVAKL